MTSTILIKSVRFIDSGLNHFVIIMELNGTAGLFLIKTVRYMDSGLNHILLKTYTLDSVYPEKKLIKVIKRYRFGSFF